MDLYNQFKRQNGHTLNKNKYKNNNNNNNNKNNTNEKVTVIVTTYNIAQQKMDRAFFRKLNFSYLILGNPPESINIYSHCCLLFPFINWAYLFALILSMIAACTDEAQLLKNSQSMRYNSLRAFQSKHTLLLTGSPLQVSFPIFPLSH